MDLRSEMLHFWLNNGILRKDFERFLWKNTKPIDFEPNWNLHLSAKNDKIKIRKVTLFTSLIFWTNLLQICDSFILIFRTKFISTHIALH